VAINRNRIALLGECLIELNGEPFGTLHQSFGGDTLNTAIYLARLLQERADIGYATALGTDALSNELLRRWQGEGVDPSLVLRDPMRRPGLYWVRRDAGGERSFTYWRGESAARFMLRHRDFKTVASALTKVNVLYLSGISLAILPEEDRPMLLELLRDLRTRGVALVFDSNYRPTLWSAPEAARATTGELYSMASLLLVTFEDEQTLWGDVDVKATLKRLQDAGAGPITIKLGREGCLYAAGNKTFSVPAESVTRVVDTTAAGDAFNAAFLAAWLLGEREEDCCRAGNRLAARVIQHPGAIMPRNITPTLSELLRT
jgi:2-dehydro-3-deoxygluconokinase